MSQRKSGPETPAVPDRTSSTVATSPASATRRRAPTPKWTHTPSTLTLIWLAVSLPLVIWDTAYVMLRPHSMTGGSLHSPIFSPYKLYATIDYVYGFPAIKSRSGFTAAQAFMNIIETAGYLVYLYLVLVNGVQKPTGKGRGAPKRSLVGKLADPRVVTGQIAVASVMICYSSAVMTVSKTMLYWLNEYFSGYANVGHNDWWTLITLWMIPNGAWLVVPSYMLYVFGAEILEGLTIAAGKSKSH